MERITAEQNPESSKGRTGTRENMTDRGNSKCKCPVMGVSPTCVVGAKQIQGKYKRRH